MMIGSVRAQAGRLKDVLAQIENDDKWKDHSSYYAKEIQEIEKNLRRIRKGYIEPIHRRS
jgi:hypothetical protein